MRLAALAMVVMVAAAGAVAWMLLREDLGPKRESAGRVASARSDLASTPTQAPRPPAATATREVAPVEVRAGSDDGVEVEVWSPNDAIGAEGLVVEGRVVVVDADGHEETASNGSFEAVDPWRGNGDRQIRPIAVHDGRFRFRLPPGASREVAVGLLTLEPDRRLAQPVKRDHTVVDGTPLTLRAAIVSPILLEVVDAKTGKALRDVSVVRVSGWSGGQPQSRRLGDEIASNAESPVEIHATRGGIPEQVDWQSRLRVSAPEHARAELDVDFHRPATIRVALDPGVDLDVTTVAPEAESWVWSQLPPQIRIYRARPGVSEPDVERLVDERMKRYAAMSDEGIGQSVPGGRRPTASEVREEVAFDLPSLRRKELWGPLVTEVPANLDETVHVRSLEPGRYVVTLQRGSSSRHPEVFAETTVDLAAGTTELTLAPLESGEVERVRVVGTLRVSRAWEFHGLRIALDPAGVAGATENDERSFPVDERSRVEGSEELYDFDVDDLRPGRYVAFVAAIDWRQAIETGAHGRDDVALVIGDPADLVVHVVDDETGKESFGSETVGVLSHGFELVERGIRPVARVDDESRTLRLRLAPGEHRLDWVSLSSRFEVIDPGPILLHPGANEVTVRMRRSTEIELSFEQGGEPVELPTALADVEVASLDDRTATRRSYSSEGARLMLRVPAAGRYLVTLPTLPGRAAVPPFEVTARRGEVVTRTIRLVPER
jgi:hypothetical protein